MNSTQPGSVGSWPLWQKILFRFFFIYFLLNIAPWEWLNRTLPGLNYVLQFYEKAMGWIIEFCNKTWFHFQQTTIVNNGSGDTSESWKAIFTYLVIAVTGTVIWSIADKKRASYHTANYWLRTFLRYFLILNCMVYGISKLYALQMPFPNQSQLATPLGDFLPMRLSWMFIGYSTPYQVFSGAMEVLAGLLLLNRKTITLGLFVGASVFINVMVLNLCYDIPVKIFSIHLVIYCFYLLANDAKRLVDLLVWNRSVAANTIHQNSLSKKWMRITRIVLKLAFIGLFVIVPFFSTREFYNSFNKPVSTKPIELGVYDVVVYAVNKDTLPALVSDTTRWRDMIFEKGGLGSVGSTDTSFRQRYRRGYFNLVTDTIRKTIGFKKTASSEKMLFTFRYGLPDSNTITLSGSRNRDSLYIVLKRSNRHFQLAEKQFHWISEANR
ncbi:MAG: hypothetical protein V4450_16915 [Bacteroidota bacterium]